MWPLFMALLASMGRLYQHRLVQTCSLGTPPPALTCSNLFTWDRSPSPCPLHTHTRTHTHTHTHTHYVPISKWPVGLQLKGFLFFKWFRPKHQQIKRHGNLPLQFSLGEWGVKSRLNPKVFHKKFLSLQIWLRGWSRLSSVIKNSKLPRARQRSSGSSGRVRGGGRETWNLCGRLWWPSFLWPIFTGPGGPWPLGPPPGSATGNVQEKIQSLRFTSLFRVL